MRIFEELSKSRHRNTHDGVVYLCHLNAVLRQRELLEFFHCHAVRCREEPANSDKPHFLLIVCSTEILQAPVGVLMDDASQAFCVLAGGKGYLRDSMVSAMLAKNKIFPNTNLLVVPVDMTEVPGGAFTGGSKGFGKPVPYEQEGYVAAPVHVRHGSFLSWTNRSQSFYDTHHTP